MIISLLQRFRRNHAIEHAAMHLLGRVPQPLRLVARSDWDGFTMYGHVDTELLARATRDGLRALRSGNAELAIHPRCGTNLAVHLLLAAAAYGAISAARKGRRRPAVPVLALSMIGAVAALGQPLSYAAQAHLFTSIDLERARIVGIRRQVRSGVPVHRVTISYD